LALFWANYLATSAMVGIIWFVQGVHYPLFHRVGASAFAAYEPAHRIRTTAVVAGPMLVEAVSAVGLLYASPPWLPAQGVYVGLGLVAVAWLITAAVSVPDHGRLTQGYQPAVVEHLVGWNWVRTVAWTLRWLILTGALMAFVTAATHQATSGF
jgi:hypothetical protein